MKLLDFGLFLAAALSAAATAGAQEIFYNPANGHYYKLSANADTFTVMSNQAAGEGGYLATIDDAAEQAWITSEIGPRTMPPWAWS